jgi:mRNA-degrading endonuclease toxin of MazEF toxin-antitoxin module
MVEHRTLNPLVPSSSLGLSISSKPRLVRGFVLCTLPSLTKIAISKDAGSIKFMSRTGCRAGGANFEGKDGFIALDQIRTVSKLRFVKKLGTIKSVEQRAVLGALVEMFADE